MFALETFKAADFNTDFGDAYFALTKCVEARTDQAAVYNLFGLIQERQGKFGGALGSFELAAIYAEPDSQEYYFHLENKARVLCSLNRYSESKENFEICRTTEWADAGTHIGLGLALFFESQLQESLECFETALKTASEISTPYFKITNILLSQVLFALGTPEHLDLARTQLMHCFEQNNQHVQAIILLLALGVSTHDWQLAGSAASELFQLDPRRLENYDFEIFELLNEMCTLQGNFESAKRYIQKSIHRRPADAKRWARLAQFLYTNDPNVGNIAARISNCGHILLTKAKSATTGTNAADVHRTAGFAFPHDARTLFLKAIRAAPYRLENWMALSTDIGIALHSQTRGPVLGYTAESLKTISMASEAIANTNGSSEDVEWARLIRANAELECTPDEIDAHLGAVDEITTQSSNSAVKQTGYVIIGQILTLAGQLEPAVQAFKHAVCLDVTWGLAWNELSNAYSSLGLTSAANASWRQVAVNLASPSRVESLLNLAKLGFLQEDHGSSQEAIGEVLKTDTDNQIARFMQTLLSVRKNSNAKISKFVEALKPHFPETIIDWLQHQ